MTISTKLVDRRNLSLVLPQLQAELQQTQLVGFDIETQDEGRHQGLNSYNTKVRKVFDHRRTVITGFSIYCEGSDTSWYFNTAHADEENRLTTEEALMILSYIPDSAIMLCHNAPFELVMVEQCWGLILKNVLCTMQLAVSHHGPDEYDWEVFRHTPLAGFYPLAKEASTAFSGLRDPNNLTSAQSEILGKFISKTSDARHSYNGFVKSISYGYGLKQLVKSIFSYEMTTYEQVLGGREHMGQLTGEDVAAYGADDAYWVVPLYKWLRDDLLKTNPKALVAFLETENPMVQVYAECWRNGIRLDLEQVYARQREERKEYAAVLRRTKKAFSALLPFPDDKNEKLADKQDWYDKHWQVKRAEITAWVMSPDSDDDFEQVTQISNPIGNAWADEMGIKQVKRLNLTHYYGMRTILYDLMGHKLLYSEGKVASDADTRGKMSLHYEKIEDKERLEVLQCLQNMADIEQRMKLYLTPYTQLMDPETGHVYPSLSSRLATRRMATSFPNPMQLAKSGGSAYIRGFYLADDDESVVISADWSSIELVLIGDMSGDPAFAEVFGQLPYGDLHSGAAADCLAVKTLPGLTEEEFKGFKFGQNPNNRILKNTVSGSDMEPKDFFKHARTAVGKVANFGYPYSGALSSVGLVLNWTSDEMWEATDRYRTRFSGMENWRVSAQQEAVDQGFVMLPDGHRRVRPEATQDWNIEMRNKFLGLSATQGMENYSSLALRRIQSRAKNQIVNAMIQGTCATLAKRSVLRLRQMVTEAGLSGLVRFLMPIHDELVFSVHKSAVLKFIPLLRQAMTEHPDIVTTLPLDCTVALGKTFEPFNDNYPQRTQIELDEAFQIEGVIGPELQGKKLTPEKIEEVVDYIFKKAA